MASAVPYDNFDDDDDEQFQEDASPQRQHTGGKTGGPVVDDDDDDEDDDDEEDDGEDDDEDEEEDDRPRKKTKKSRRKNRINRFIDAEAVVDDDEEDLEDDEEELTKESREFIAAEDDAVDDEDYRNRITAGHNRFAREREDDDQDLARVAQDLKERYSRTTARYTGDSSDVPQRLLMPGVQDAFLWQVRVRPGKERDLVFQLMRKALDMEFSSRPLEIFSAFERDSLPGMIYVEARSQKHVQDAVDGLVGVFLGRGIVLVPIDEMASLLRIKKQVTTIVPGSWVRIKRGKHAGDLAQVLDVTDNGEEAGLKFIPRIDLTPKEDYGNDKKRKKGAASSNLPLAFRPPQRFFNAEEVSKVFKNKVNLKPGHSRKFVFNGDTYNNGFCEKDVKISGLITENVNPTLDEITRFTHGDQESADGAENQVDLSIIADAARKAATSVLQPGDHVEVFEGEQTGMHGVVESIQGDVVALRAKHVDIEGQRIEVPASSVRKKFKAGDHVKVMTGKNSDETGLVVSVLNDVVTFLSDMTMQEVTVFSKDVREAAEVGAGTNAVGNYELHDLVQLDQQTVGVIYKTERDSFRVLDQNGQTRLVQPHQIAMRKDSRRAIATDAQGYEIRVNDNMKESDGEQRKGRILHIHQSHYAFLHNRELTENGGVFVTRARGLQSVAPKGVGVIRPNNGPDLSKLNPAIGLPVGGMVGSGMNGKGGPRDRLIGTQVVVVKGSFKGYLGRIKDTNGALARVELHTQNKVITIEKEKLKRKTPDGKIEPLESGMFNMGAMNNRNGGPMGPPSVPSSQGSTMNGGWGDNLGSQTPRSSSAVGRTPNPYLDGGRTPGLSGSRTPAWGDPGSRTPGGGSGSAWAAGSKTPNPWAASSRTPNPYASGKTPNPYTSREGGEGGAGGRTPFGSGPGGRTPAGAGRGFGGATPNPYRNDPRSRPGATTPGGAGASSNGGWGDSGSGSGGWGDSNDDWSGAPTPGPISAPTPGAFGGNDDWTSTATTPYGGAPTPYATAPTPGVLSAPTPGAYYAQTPGAMYAQTPGLSAPTPGMLGAPTPGPGQASSYVAQDEVVEPRFSDDNPWVVGCKNVWVEVIARQDLPESSFHNGLFDGQRAVVLQVSDNRDNFTEHVSTANLRFMSGPERGQDRAVPVVYLKPVRPMPNEKAMVLSGEWKHKVMNVQMVDHESVVPLALGELDDTLEIDTELKKLALTNLVKYQEW